MEFRQNFNSTVYVISSFYCFIRLFFTFSCFLYFCSSYIKFSQKLWGLRVTANNRGWRWNTAHRAFKSSKTWLTLLKNIMANIQPNGTHSVHFIPVQLLFLSFIWFTGYWKHPGSFGFNLSILINQVFTPLYYKMLEEINNSYSDLWSTCQIIGLWYKLLLS